MAYVDSRLDFQPITSLKALGALAAGATVILDNAVPLTNVRDIGAGEGDLYLVVIATADGICATTTTLVVDILTDANVQTPALPPMLSPTIMQTSQPLAITASIATTAWQSAQSAPTNRKPVVVMKLQPGLAWETHLGVQVRNTGAVAMTSGAQVAAYLTRQPAEWRSYADAVN
jgi:hypothetical protein